MLKSLSRAYPGKSAAKISRHINLLQQISCAEVYDFHRIRAVSVKLVPQNHDGLAAFVALHKAREYGEIMAKAILSPLLLTTDSHRLWFHHQNLELFLDISNT
jgi:hypothetical protein